MPFLQSFLIFAAGGVTVLALEVLQLQALLAPIRAMVEGVLGGN